MNHLTKGLLCLLIVSSVLLMTGCTPDNTWRGAASLSSAGEGLFIYAMPNELLGYVDSQGHVISEAQWSQATRFYQGLAAVCRDGKCGYINTKGEIVIPLEYENAYTFSEDGLAIVSKSGLYGFINMQGEEVIPLKYEKASAFSEGLAVVGWNGKYRYIRPDGTEAFKDDYAKATSFQNGMAYVVRWSGLVQDGMFINLSGQKVFDCPWEYNYGSFSGQGLCRRWKGIDDYGYVNRRGDVVIPPHWNFAWDFDENDRACVKDDAGRVGMIGLDGALVLDCEYQHIYSCVDGAYIVRKNDKYGMIDMHGAVLVDCVYDSLSWLRDERVFLVEQDGKCGYLNSDGSVLLPLQYDDASSASGSAVAVKQGGRWRIIDLQGNVLAE